MNFEFEIFSAEKRKIRKLLQLRNPENAQNFLEVTYFILQFREICKLGFFLLHLSISTIRK